ncbi:hypothetical protein EI42_05419 [Thermosporothrix hazakensis]|uniref:MalT-like TPR region domain-containing protein n=2 Tax=Thermosporothrix TaxID=768650 RepID=A0A326U257_THEHA|nr:hypothetical protein [Thermosporothrix hazakensis]PZW22513.1 hypothetical protein EI42_05419 [Thermosporothrix hazakensis]BBH87766.1 hypothetical protein KTC_25170 [Thermosporothrix sp. COM3]GCE50202.1 hypothetical protein KTH_50710 [Thermosporothrix hazakensis]
MHKRWWERLEQFNRVPVDEKRRWLIHTLLNIPPAYLGLQSLSNLNELQTIFQPTPGKLPPVNLNLYKERLLSFWQNPYVPFDEPLSLIYALQDYALYHDASDSTMRLLCEYLIAVANMQRAQGYLTSAEASTQKAIQLAERRDYPSLLAKAFYMQSYILCEMHRASFDSNPTQMAQALEYAEKALHITEHYAVPPLVESAIRERFATALSLSPRSHRDLSVARQQNDLARLITERYQSQHDEYPLFHRIDQSWHIIGIAHMHLAMKEPKTALTILKAMPPAQPGMRRFLTAKIKEAEATIQAGYLDEGLTIAESTLSTVKNSPLHLIRLHNLYQDLRNDDRYTREPSVIQFGFRLVKTHRPDLFQ